MKKLVLVLAILMVLPAAAFGIQYDLMNDGNMEDVTGQAGVSILFDDIQLFLNIERIAWLDCDGFDTAGTYDSFNCTGDGGALGLQNFQLDVLEINAITRTDGDADGSPNGEIDLQSASCGSLDLNWDYGDTTVFDTGCAIATGYSFNQLGTFALQTKGLNNYDQDVNNGSGAIAFSALTIDATSQLPALTEQYTNNEGAETNVGGVLIGIPTMEIYIPNMTLTPAFYNLADQTAADNDVDGDDDVFGDSANFGTIEMSGITFTTLSGWIEIAPH